MKPESSLAANAIVWATSSGVTSLPIGLEAPRLRILFGRHQLLGGGVGHRRRRDQVGGDAVRRQLQCDVTNELVHRRFGGAERDHAFSWTTRQYRRQIDEPAEATGDHARHNSFGDQKRGVQLAVQLAAQLLPIQLSERGDLVGDQGVVHQHIDPPPTTLSLREQRRNVVGIGDIGSYRPGLAARCGYGLDHLVGFFGAGAVVDRDPEFPLREQLSGRRANASAGAGDHRDTIHRPLRYRLSSRRATAPTDDGQMMPLDAGLPVAAAQALRKRPNQSVRALKATFRCFTEASKSWPIGDKCTYGRRR